MAMKAPFSESRKCSKYKVSNNREYNNILRSRGRLDLMISADLAVRVGMKMRMLFVIALEDLINIAIKPYW